MSPPEMLAAETREWLDRARADLRACEVLMQAGLHGEALFHAQQCVEKAMMAVLTWHQIPFKKTHDLDELRQACLPLNPEFAALLAGVERLSQYAWRFRYPGAPYLPERAEAEQAHSAASRLLESLTVYLESQSGS